MVNETTYVEQLTDAFQTLTSQFIAQTERKLTLAKAMGDREGVVKEHIKIEVMKTAWEMFERCCQRIDRLDER